jgi:hypothetical protein
MGMGSQWLVPQFGVSGGLTLDELVWPNGASYSPTKFLNGRPKSICNDLYEETNNIFMSPYYVMDYVILCYGLCHTFGQEVFNKFGK